MMRQPWHVTIHARPTDAAPGPLVNLAGATFQTLHLRGQPDAPFERSFETVAQALGQLDRLFLEPDGSLVWVSPAGEPAWQLDCMLYDRAGRLLYVELKGECEERAFDRFLSALGWPETPVMFQLVRSAVLLDEAEFRRSAGW
jgi:hypothetical protein